MTTDTTIFTGATEPLADFERTRAVAIAYRLAADAIGGVVANLHGYADGLEDEEYDFVMDHQDEVITALRSISDALARKARS